MAGLSDVLLVNTKAMSGTGQLNANASVDGEDSKQVSNFVTAQSFSTFAVASVILKTLWELLQKLAGGWANSYWTPFVICLLYGLWQVLISVFGDKKLTGFAAISSAVVVGLVNAGILAASIIGVTEVGVGST